MATVYVNGEECNLHESVGWLNYDRVVRLSGLPPNKYYDVIYWDKQGFRHSIGSGVFPLEGTQFKVTERDKKPWWRWLWPE